MKNIITEASEEKGEKKVRAKTEKSRSVLSTKMRRENVNGNCRLSSARGWEKWFGSDICREV